MNYKTGDIVYFYHTSDREYGWHISDFTKCEITNKAFDTKGNMFYSLRYFGGESTWYLESDLLSEKEYRKYKLKKLISQ
jgi:hypothetical protein